MFTLNLRLALRGVHRKNEYSLAAGESCFTYYRTHADIDTTLKLHLWTGRLLDHAIYHSATNTRAGRRFHKKQKSEERCDVVLVCRFGREISGIVTTTYTARFVEMPSNWCRGGSDDLHRGRPSSLAMLLLLLRRRPKVHVRGAPFAPRKGQRGPKPKDTRAEEWRAQALRRVRRRLLWPARIAIAQLSLLGLLGSYEVSSGDAPKARA